MSVKREEYIYRIEKENAALRAEIERKDARNNRLVDGLENIANYWNQDRNDQAMFDALMHMEDVVAKLADLVAVWCMSWGTTVIDVPVGDETLWYTSEDKPVMPVSWWQPHKDTEKGKAQCWDLIMQFHIHYWCKGSVSVAQYGDFIRVVEKAKNGQTAVLKACLLSVLAQQEK